MSLEEFHISKQVLDRFCIAGINYHKADAATRGLFSITNEAFVTLGKSAKAAGLKSVFVVSTCNRTEIYGFAESVMQLVELLVPHTHGDKAAFYECGYFKNGEEALQHLFNVAAGLDSQILGDYEILGQLKRAVDTARGQQLIGPVMDRMLSFAFQASKKIKTETNLSDGTVSVSFAAIELLQNIKDIAQKKVLIIGAGKFGVNVCKNLNTYLPHTSVTIMNRTDAVAEQIAADHGIRFASYADKAAAIRASDIVIVCTNASEPMVVPAHVAPGAKQLFLDLSVPVNVHPAIRNMDQVTVIDVDEISNTILDKTLAKRKAEVPRALNIIEYFKKEFLGWLRDYHYALHLKTWKNKLREIDLMQTGVCEFYKDKELISETERVMRAQKAVKQLAVNLKVRHDKGCQFISSINDYLQLL
ncbi:glutamyl-tRNA reductase [Niabella sp. CC-SYL272]|uniref:glutamyl-tRNA reductase n=1 Tax=Niabella agricola TaxID=2891571 RepID=UPI001F010123|nr:glutamyl-tRNA reductase [Niabella agricola]MCF3110363.1 glutamyl-tRNA reductase [Niabella agricola]